ncbi:MAG: lysylphosphatidylglycerol synthase transmembrane domain-containing protein, partial [Saprospiraceae bacterium]
MAATSAKTTVINLIKFLLFLSVGLVILYLVYRSQSNAYLAECALKEIPAEDCVLWRKVLADFRSANYGWLVIVIVCFCISNWSRAIRWNMLLRQLGYQPRWINAFLTINLGYFANLGLPRLGEVVRITTMSGYEKIPVEQVAGTVVADRVIDVISMLLVSALAVFLAYDQVWAWLDASSNLGDKLSGVWPLLLAAGLVGVAGLGIAWWQRARIRSSRFGAKVEQLLIGFAEGLRTVA